VRIVLILPTVASCLLCACATQPAEQWYRAGASQQDFAMDQGQCQAQGFGISGAPLLQTAIVYNSCMRGKGWVLLSTDQMPTAQTAPTKSVECVPLSEAQRKAMPWAPEGATTCHSVQ
jgi:hypothetical protein